MSSTRKWYEVIGAWFLFGLGVISVSMLKDWIGWTILLATIGIWIPAWLKLSRGKFFIGYDPHSQLE